MIRLIGFADAVFVPLLTVVAMLLRPSSIILQTSCILQLIALVAVPIERRCVGAQENGFEIPVQLLGFPVIIMAVRMSNFVKKLAYSLSPSTYRSSRTIKRIDHNVKEPRYEVEKAEKILLANFGPNLCIYEDICLQSVRKSGSKTAKDWEKVMRNYGKFPTNKQHFYLLSVFLGDIIASDQLCQHFKRSGRTCDVYK